MQMLPPTVQTDLVDYDNFKEGCVLVRHPDPEHEYKPDSLFMHIKDLVKMCTHFRKNSVRTSGQLGHTNVKVKESKMFLTHDTESV